MTCIKKQIIALISVACYSANLFVRSPASVVFDKYPECPPAIPICLLAFRNIPLFFDGAAYLTFRLHILKYFGVFFLYFWFAYLHLLNTRREITALDEVLVCMTLHCVCRVSLYPCAQFCHGNARNKKLFPVVDLWSLLMRSNAASSGIVVTTHLYPDLTPLVTTIHSRFIWCLVLIEWCTSAIKCNTTKSEQRVADKFLL